MATIEHSGLDEQLAACRVGATESLLKVHIRVLVARNIALGCCYSGAERIRGGAWAPLSCRCCVQSV